MNRKPLLAISLDRRLAASLQDQLARSLKQLIHSGILEAGHALPSSREIAKDLNVSRNTVVAACDRLLGEGYLEAVPRAGLYVAQQLADISKMRSQHDKREERDDMESRHVVDANRLRPSSRNLRRVTWPDLSAAIPFRPCRPDVSLFPYAKWNRYRNLAVRKLGTSLFQYQPSCVLGLTMLRKEIAIYLRESRGVPCDWQQIAVTNGSQQALFILAQLVLQRGERVAMEDPGYPGARDAMIHAGAALTACPVDAMGLVPEHVPKNCKLIYTTPSRQFPTGVCMPASRRLALIQLAEQNHAWLIEDDYDSEFRYSRPPLPSLHSLAATDRVIYVGSMSKVLCPTLRIGFVVLPFEFIDSFARLRGMLDDQGAMIDQAALAMFLANGDFYSHIRRCRKAYASRLNAFLEGVSKYHLPLHFPSTDGGMNLAGFFDAESPPKRSSQKKIGYDAQVSQHLAHHGFDTPCLSRYSTRSVAQGLLFGFTAFQERAIGQHLQAMSKLF